MMREAAVALQVFHSTINDALARLAEKRNVDKEAGRKTDLIDAHIANYELISTALNAHITELDSDIDKIGIAQHKEVVELQILHNKITEIVRGLTKLAAVEENNAAVLNSIVAYAHVLRLIDEQQYFNDKTQ